MTIKMDEYKIFEKVDEYCNYYNLPIQHIDKIISGLKVIPMIRGIGFEYTVSDALRDKLSDAWEISNPNINAQSEIHDVDVCVMRKEDHKKIRIECKLAGKDSFKYNRGSPKFKVKCMRSRTVSDNEAATKMAEKYKVSRDSILSHADNYRADDFDYVITSMGNALWITDNGEYTFKDNTANLNILSNLFPNYFSNTNNSSEFKERAYNFILIARSDKINVSPINNITCSRRKCNNNGTKTNCGFIPNYPIVFLKDVASNKSPWKILADLDLDTYFEKSSTKVNCSLSEFV